MTEMVIDYTQRAANVPRPMYFEEPAEVMHTPETFAMFAEATNLQLWADWSVFQPVVTAAYPYPIGAFRLDSGYAIDGHGRANDAAMDAMGKKKIGYIVPVKATSWSVQFSRIKNAYGSEFDGALMLDEERGAGFHGSGNHSSMLNEAALELAAWSTCGQAGVAGYANGSDWSTNWPTREPWMKRVIAAYNSTEVYAGYWGHQYYGGMDYPVPAGLPRSCAPFGGHIDLNVAPMATSDLLASLGFGVPAGGFEGLTYQINPNMKEH